MRRYMAATIAIVATGLIIVVGTSAPTPKVSQGRGTAIAASGDMAHRTVGDVATRGSTVSPSGTSTDAPEISEGASRRSSNDSRLPDAQVDRADADIALAPIRRGREPVNLALPDLGVQSPVAPTWMDATRSIVVPDDVMSTGWYDGSRRPGAARGTSVIVGHRDSSTQGAGVLSGIENLSIGSTVAVTNRDGSVHSYAIEAVELIEKTDLPLEAARIFTTHGPHRLVLITCGGAFDEAARSYLSNVVVTALPVDTGPQQS